MSVTQTLPPRGQKCNHNMNDIFVKITYYAESSKALRFNKGNSRAKYTV